MAKKDQNGEYSPSDQFSLTRLLMQQEHPEALWHPVGSVGEGIAQGIGQVAQQYAQHRQQKQMMQYLQQAQQQQQQAAQEAAQQQQAQLQMFLYRNGVDPNVAQSAPAGLDASTVNNVLSHSYDVSKDGTEQGRKGVIFQGVYQSLINKGVDPDSAVLSATKAAYGAEPIGASEIGTQIGGDLKTKQMGQIIGQGDVNHSPMSPMMQMQLGNYGVQPVDAVSESNRQSTAGIAATNNQWLPTINDASVRNKNASTDGQIIGNNRASIGLAREGDQYSLGQGYVNGTVTGPEMLKGSIGLSDNPVGAMNTVAGNKNLYKNGDLVPKGGLDFPAPTPTAPALPAPQPQANPIQSFYNLSPQQQQLVGPMIRQSIMNMPGQAMNQVNQNVGQGAANLFNGIQSTRRLLGW